MLKEYAQISGDHNAAHEGHDDTVGGHDGGEEETKDAASADEGGPKHVKKPPNLMTRMLTSRLQKLVEKTDEK